jgi:intracellular multiplication protein IcmJ
MLSLNLSVSLENYSYFTSRKANAAFRKTIKNVWQRDKFTCQYCGFQAKEYQEVVNKDGNYRNNNPTNLKTACCFCAQCFFLESVGDSGYGGGTLVYLPEMTQNELNSLCHVLFCAMSNDASYKDSAQTMYRTLRSRVKWVEEHLGEGVSQPAVFGQLYLDYQAMHHRAPKEILTNLRLLPSRGRFQKQIQRWATSAMSEI